jgi:hypothetical protein
MHGACSYRSELPSTNVQIVLSSVDIDFQHQDDLMLMVNIFDCGDINTATGTLNVRTIQVLSLVICTSLSYWFLRWLKFA